MTTTTVMTGIVKTSGQRANGVHFEQYAATGESHRNALTNLVVALLRDESRNIPTEQAVTILRAGTTLFGVPVIQSDEGRFYERHDGYLAFLPKGKRTRGYRVARKDVLAVRDGFNRHDEVTAVVTDLVATLPTLETLTEDDLRTLPTRGSTCSVAALGTSPFYDGPLPGIWLLHSYLPDAQIAEGVFVVADGFGAVTEHGSAYTADLCRRFGKVTVPVAVPVAEALNLTFDQALAVAQ